MTRTWDMKIHNCNMHAVAHYLCEVTGMVNVHNTFPWSTRKWMTDCWLHGTEHLLSNRQQFHTHMKQQAKYTLRVLDRRSRELGFCYMNAWKNKFNHYLLWNINIIVSSSKWPLKMWERDDIYQIIS